MTVSITFDVKATEDEPMRPLLQELDALPHWERELMIGRIMVFRGQQMIENAAGALAVAKVEARRLERARATRERNKAAKGEGP